jgi:hypothetical protein
MCRRGILHVLTESIEHVSLRLRTRFAQTVRLELVFQKPLNFLRECLRRLKLRLLQNLSRTLNRLSVVARFKRHNAAPASDHFAEPIDLASKIDAANSALEHPRIFRPMRRLTAPVPAQSKARSSAKFENATCRASCETTVAIRCSKLQICMVSHEAI